MSFQLPIEADKQVLRAKARAARNAISTGERLRSADAVARIGLRFLNIPPSIVGGYAPVRSEFDCMPLLERLAGDGWDLALPVTPGDAPLEFHNWSLGEPLTPGPFGILEPGDGNPVTPRVLLVPLLAFDRRGYRLGYGGGYYDRTLAALRQNTEITAVGLAFEAQEVAEVPACTYDERLDHILTPSGPISPKDGP